MKVKHNIFFNVIRKKFIWGLGIGDWPNPQSPIPNPQSPIPNPHQKNELFILILIKKVFYLYIFLALY